LSDKRGENARIEKLRLISTFNRSALKKIDQTTTCGG